MFNLFNSAFAQTRQIRFDRIAGETELAEANVLTILQDKKGFMWFGTSAGLYRYDGYGIRSFKSDPSNKYAIASDFIQSIFEGRNGDIWIATIGGGFSKFDRKLERFTNYKNSLSTRNSLLIDDVNTIIEDDRGMIWLGTNEGLDHFNPFNGDFTHFVHNPSDKNSIGDNYVRKICEDNAGNIWIATSEGGLNLYNRASRNFTRFQNQPGNESSLFNNDVHSIFQDSKGRLWIGTANNGLDLFDPASKKFIHFNGELQRRNAAGTAIACISEDQFGNIWLGTENGGLVIFDSSVTHFSSYKHDAFDPKGLVSNSINTIVKGRKGNMWVGTFNSGAIMENADGSFISHYMNIPGRMSLNNNSVLCIAEMSDKKIWIGTDGGGINVFDPASEEFKYMKHDSHNANSICGDNVLTMCEDRRGNIWIGTWGNGISVYNKATKKFRHYKHDPNDKNSLSNNNTWKIFQARNGEIWIGTYGGGVNKFIPETNSFLRYERNPETVGVGLNDNWINSFFEDSRGHLFICTSGGGINILDRNTGLFSYIQPNPAGNSITNSNVNAITEDREGNLWIATMGGLNKLDKSTGRYSVFSTKDGLAGNLVYGILQDEKGKLWISTDNGISSFDPRSGTFVNLGKADGLQSLRFKENAYYITKSGELYFGGNNGFNRFHPADLKSKEFDPELVITSLRIDNRELDVKSEDHPHSPLKESIDEARSVTLSYKNSVITFSFASLNYTSREKKQYAFMLEGFDSDWQEVGSQNSATYTNLDPGTYVFKVKGLNNQGAWSEKIASVEVIITPPFWLTWWFRISVVLAVLGIVFGIYFARVNIIKKQKRLLEQKVDEQTAELKFSNAQEKAARKEADRANENLAKKNAELEQFVYIASHDLREPLRTTAGFAELLKRQYGENLDDKATSYLNFILSSTERMRVLINDLLEYSRIGADSKRQDVDLDDLVKNVLADLGTAIKESNATITVGHLPVVNGYATAIKQLFQNLIANAIKFKKKDVDPEIRIESQEMESEWKFSVRDNGIGINPKFKEKIFMIFQRLHHRNEYEGSGIGLAHCKKIVEMHNGKIWIESEPGEGCTFYFTFPKN